ncbi:MAG: acyltransferase [Saccharofermentans sp.]|nr:acyltransferase [Saccharofermentans sp.]
MAIGTDIFPYNSFYMPLFVFASGYFFKDKPLIDSIKGKIKKLFIPYIIWNIVFLFVASLIDRILDTHWVQPLTLSSTIMSLFDGSTCSINGPAWFAIMLFWVSIIYILVKKFVPSSIFADITTSIVIVCGAIFSLWMCIFHYDSIRSSDSAWLVRAIFYLAFYDMGHIFNKYIESRLLKLNTLTVCLICVLTNITLIYILKFNINFYSTSSMESFSNILLPFISSLTGIVFYYELARVISAKLGSIRIIDFIGRNTFTIMETHLLFVNLPAMFIYSKIQSGSSEYQDFPINTFVNSAWSRYQPTLRIGFWSGLIGSILIAFIIESVKKYYLTHKNQNHSTCPVTYK